MSDALKKLETDIITAMKGGDRTRLDVLRMFVNRVKMTAKNDGNRAVTDADVLTAGLKTVKEANETRDIYVGRGVETVAQDTEISIVSEYLPRQMAEDDLRAVISGLKDIAPDGKAAKGFIMKELNGQHRGTFDPRMANQIVGELTQ